MVDEKKKKKLTLTASPKKPVNVPLYIQDKKKTSVIVEKRIPKHLRTQIYKKRHQIEVLKLEKLQRNVQQEGLKI